MLNIQRTGAGRDARLPQGQGTSAVRTKVIRELYGSRVTLFWIVEAG
jgi:hypothetical protein